MSSTTVLTRYDDKGEQTKGYVRALVAIQQYEECIVEFERYTTRKWKECFERTPEPSWWQRNIKEVTREELARSSCDTAQALYVLFHHITYDTLTNSDVLISWKRYERIAFNGKVDVAKHYKQYDDLRHNIRCGSVFMLDSDTCRFVNTFNKRLTIFQ